MLFRSQVMSIPTMIVFKGGQPAKTIVGAMPKKRLEAEIELLEAQISVGMLLIPRDQRNPLLSRETEFH